MARLPRYRTGDEELDEQIAQLVAHLGDAANTDLIFELIVSAVHLAGDRADRGDLKIANAALKEMRHAFHVFAPYRSVRKCAIFGSARTHRDDPLYRQTVQLARDLAAVDWMVITGAGPGIMEAGVEGAGAESSFGVGIQLPFEATTTEFLAEDEKLIVFRYFFTRKLTFMKEADGFVLLPGGFGTMDECFELLTLVQTGKAQVGPIVLLDVPGGTYWSSWTDFIRRELERRGYISPEDNDLYLVTDDPQVAVDELRGFFSNYHSQRYVGGNLVLRLQREPDAQLVDRLNREFADIVEHGTIEACEPSRDELLDHDHVELPRIRLRFDRRSYARLRELVNALNGREQPRP